MRSNIDLTVLVTAFVFALAAGCDDGSARADGEECFTASECAPGLLCDFNSTPPVCRPSQSDMNNPGTPQVDAAAPSPDTPDAAPASDASPEADAAPPEADAAPPDASVADAASLDAL